MSENKKCFLYTMEGVFPAFVGNYFNKEGFKYYTIHREDKHEEAYNIQASIVDGKFTDTQNPIFYTC